MSSEKTAIEKLKEGMEHLAGQALITADQMEQFCLLFDARAELKERLNIRLQGGDPGHPFNWRGERGLFL